jgi:hypothetical protein
MSKNSSSSQLDTDQIIKKVFQEDLEANRVVLVGGEKININVDSAQIGKSLGDVLKEYMRDYSAPQLISAPYIEEHAQEPIVVTVKEIERIEIPTIITQIEYRTIEVPVLIEKIVTVEVPIVIKEVEFKEIIKERDFPNWYKICFILQTIVVCSILISRFIK